MFYYVEGKVALTGGNFAVIDCGGVGFNCATSTNTLASIHQGETARLYTYLSVKEDALDLFGFASEEEMNCFKMLLSVSGVGPKAALSILSASTPSQIALGILSGDTNVLTAAQGVGKKLAQRIILETKDKISKEEDLLSGGETLPAVSTATDAAKEKEVIAALQVLGYRQKEAAQALRGLDIEHSSVEDLIRQTLAKMMKE